MPLDHYVSQVHLKNFVAADGMLRVIKKSDLKAFPTKTQDVCRLMDGNNNPFLQQERIVEEYLKDIEPRYNDAVQRFRDGKPDAQAIHVIAGFVIYVIVCSPTGGRLHAKPLEERLLMEARRLEAEGVVPPAPEQLGNKKLSALVEDGIVRFDVDPKFPQAIGVEDFHRRISLFGNSRWEILHNDQSAGAYFTSDYPVAIETFDIDTPINRIVPLAPDLAVRIMPDKSLKGRAPDLQFKEFFCVVKKQSVDDVRRINRLLIQCAEDMVFFGTEADWITKFITRNRGYRIEAVTVPAIQSGKKGLIVTHRIRPKQP